MMTGMRPVRSRMSGGRGCSSGTADAVYQNLGLLYHHCQRTVAVFGADHIYRMDIAAMTACHQRLRADATTTALPVPRVSCSQATPRS